MHICLRIVKGTEFSTIRESRRFDLATRFCERKHFYSESFLPWSSRREGWQAKGGWGQGGTESTGRGERDKKREDQRRRNTWPSAWLPAAHSWSWMLRQRIPVAPRALINVSRECVGNLIVRALFPFLFYCSFLLYFSPTNSSSLSLPLSFCRPRTVFRSVSLQVFLLPLEVLHSIHTTPLFQLCSLGFSISRYVNRPISVSNSVINSHAVTRDSRTFIRAMFLILRNFESLQFLYVREILENQSSKEFWNILCRL